MSYPVLPTANRVYNHFLILFLPSIFTLFHITLSINKIDNKLYVKFSLNYFITGVGLVYVYPIVWIHARTVIIIVQIVVHILAPTHLDDDDDDD